MSVIVAKVYPNKIVVCADSIVVKGWHIKNTTGNFLKIKRVNDLVIGGCGEAWESSLMYIYAQTHQPAAASEKDVLAYITEFFTWAKSYSPDFKTIKNTYLLIYGRKLFEISDGLFVTEIKDFAAIGCGEEFALAAMHLGHNPQEAVRVACELSCFVAEPIHTEVVEWNS